MSELSREPMSWLLLERYALGELEQRERDDVERRLAESIEERARLDTILADEVALPPLPVPRRKPRAFYYGGLAIAAAVMLAVLRPSSRVPDRRTIEGVKGGDVAISLLSEHGGVHPSSYAQGERFKVLVTCPPAWRAPLRVIVFQGQARYQPLADFEPACGNAVPWPGAFSLDGTQPVEVCITWSAVDARSADELSPDVVCEHLEPRR